MSATRPLESFQPMSLSLSFSFKLLGIVKAIALVLPCLGSLVRGRPNARLMAIVQVGASARNRIAAPDDSGVQMTAYR